MIVGIGIGDYRSIGTLQRIYPLGRINVFAGANNSGKSNILRFLYANLAACHSIAKGESKKPLASVPHVRRAQPSIAEVALTASLAEFSKTLNLPGSPATERLHAALFSTDPLWIGNNWPNEDLLNEASSWLSHWDWQNVWSKATKSSGGSINQHWVPQTLRQVRSLIQNPPEVYDIPIARRADSELTPQSPRVISGHGVIKRLAAMQNPTSDQYTDNRERFSRIEQFVRTVVDDISAEISVTHNQDEILVKLKEQPFLPLADLGSGIEQVVLHAVAATSVSNSIITFEEPELHLHPILQRQLLHFLATRTTNQYFISTHSAHMIDTLHANVFHVKLVKGETVVEFANADASRHRICEELGYRPSDLVQANCIIWVEGPSDRIYINHWLGMFDSQLREGIHYSVMFYGGKLLSHLSAAETDIRDSGLVDLIQLRMINRHIAVLIDSDRSSGRARLRSTKKRVMDEISKNGGIVWVTAGREVENYIPREVLATAVEEISPGKGAHVDGGRFSHALPKSGKTSKTSMNKVEVAKKVAGQRYDLTRLDLLARLNDLSSFVRAANGMDARPAVVEKRPTKAVK